MNSNTGLLLAARVQGLPDWAFAASTISLSFFTKPEHSLSMVATGTDREVLFL